MKGIRKSSEAASIILLAAVVSLVTAFPALAEYDPQKGRFFQRDPAGYQNGANLYESVRSSPVNYVDWNGAGAEKPGDGKPGSHPKVKPDAPKPKPGDKPRPKPKPIKPTWPPPPKKPTFWNPCGCRVHRQEIRITKLKDSKDPEIGNEAYEEFIGHTWIDCGGGIYDYPAGFQDDRQEKSEWIWGTSKALIGKIKSGPGVGKDCKCANCKDIKACLQAVENSHYPRCSYNEAGLGVFPPPAGQMNCRYHIVKSLSSCCLIQNLFPDRAFGIGPTGTLVGGEK